MHVGGYSADAIESGPAALPRGSDHPLGPDLPLPGTIGPEDAIPHQGWREACERALAAVLAGPGVVLILGAPGTGKTLLLQHLAPELRARGVDVLLSTRGYFDVADEGIGGGESGQRRAVLIDEADRLSPESLGGLGRLGRCAFVLVGVTEPREDSGPIADEGATIVRLAALPAGEVGAFVTARLVQAGLRPDILTEGAIERLAEHSGGIPRVLNILTGSALFLARTAQASRVDAAHVIEAAALRDGQLGLAAEPSAEPSPPAEPPPAKARPTGAAPASISGIPMRSPPVTLTGARPPRSKRRRRTSGAVWAGAFAAACLASVAAWLLIQSGRYADRAVPRTETVLAPASATPPPPPVAHTATREEANESAAAGRPEPGASAPSGAAVSAPAPKADTSADATPAEARPRPRHRSNHPRTLPSRPQPAMPANRSGVLELRERPPAEAAYRDHVPVSRPAPSQSPEASERRAPKYIGTYSTGPDGVRGFRASP
jgi:hypothetical protein